MSELSEGNTTEHHAVQAAKQVLQVRTLQSLHQEEKERHRAEWGALRLRTTDLLERHSYDIIMGVVIALNGLLVIFETDSRAANEEEVLWKELVNLFFLIVYMVDVCMRIFAFRLEYFFHALNWLDLFVVLTDVISLAIQTLIGDMPSFSVLRVCRLFRLAKCLKVFTVTRELNIMLIGFASAMKAMFWAGIMLMVMLTIWSIIAVELLHPINLQLAERGIYADCSRCPRAFSSVMNANLTFLQQIVAGDSWGQVSVPIIEEVPATAVIFVCVMVTINLGLLNLVLTAIVDVAHNAREADLQQKLTDKQNEFEAAKKKLLDLCETLDEDGSGTLTLSELMQGFHSSIDFAKTMAAMDVQERDMDVIFRLLDEDHSGTVSYTEFVEQLHKMKSQDTHTMLVFIKGYLNEVRLRMGEQLRVMQEDVRGDCKAMQSALLRLTGSVGVAEEEVNVGSVEVQIDGAQGLDSANCTGAPYCVCEVVGKPAAKVQTSAAMDPQSPIWGFKDSISDFASGDSLTFSVWAHSTDREDALLGKAVLTSDQMVTGKDTFNGELALDSSETACLRVKVANLDTSHRRGLDPADQAASLTHIGKDIKQLSHRVESQITPLIRDMFRQMNEQLVQLQEQISSAAWPSCAASILTPSGFQDDTPPSCPTNAGEVKCLPQSRAGTIAESSVGGTNEQQPMVSYSPDSVDLVSALAAAPSLPWPSPMSRV